MSKGEERNLYLKVTRSWLRGSAADFRPRVAVNETCMEASSRFPSVDCWYRPVTSLFMVIPSHCVRQLQINFRSSGGQSMALQAGGCNEGSGWTVAAAF